ncbi:MAG: hypothetical protein DRQ56_03575 [Gammaproteobacteria bacterium]|nr:MAG: hypothetical protein DRQ56_03575 [Gammaproteobacteria bacterium]
MTVDENTVDENTVAPEQHTIMTIELAGPISVLRSIMVSANGSSTDPFLNFLAYLHGTTQNMSLNIRSVYMEDPDER